MTLWLNPKRTHVYVCEAERKLPPEQQTRWHMRPLKSHEWEDRKDRSRVVEPGNVISQKVLMGTWTELTLTYGLVNVEGPSLPVPFSLDPVTGYVQAEFLDYVLPEVRQELAQVINRLSTVSAADNFE